MNTRKSLCALLCLTMIMVVLPACRNRKKDVVEVPVRHEDVNTMIDLDTLVEETEQIDVKISKF